MTSADLQSPWFADVHVLASFYTHNPDSNQLMYWEEVDQMCGIATEEPVAPGESPAVSRSENDLSF